MSFQKQARSWRSKWYNKSFGKLNRDVLISPSASQGNGGETYAEMEDAPVVRVAGKINGYPATFLVDTGASRCFIRESCWKQWGNGRLRPCTSIVTQANGSPLEISGTETIQVTLGQNTASTEVSICSNLAYQCILGCNFIRRNHCLVDPSSGFIDIRGSRVAELPAASARAVLCRTVNVPACTEVITPVPINCEESRGPSVVEPDLKCFDKLGLLVGRSVINGLEGAVVLRNGSSEPVTVHRNTHVGTITECAVISSTSDTVGSENAKSAAERFDWGEAKKHLSTRELKRAK